MKKIVPNLIGLLRKPELYVILPIGTDLALLAMCDHIIISHGTYGMWAAFLASSTNTHIMVKLTTCFHEFFEYKFTFFFLLNIM